MAWPLHTKGGMRMKWALAIVLCGCATGGPKFITASDGTASAPAPLDPSDGFVTVDEKPQWGWVLAPGTDGGRVEVCEDDKCERPLITIAGGTRVTSPRSMRTGVYWWRLRGRRGDQWGTATTPLRKLAIELRTSLPGELLDLEVPREDVATGKRLVVLADRVLRHYAEEIGQPVPAKRLLNAYYGTEPGYHTSVRQAAFADVYNHGGFSNSYGAHMRWQSPLPRASEQGPGAVEGVLFHELAHQIQIHRVEGYQRQPGWLAEGLADTLAERALAKFFNVDGLRIERFNDRLKGCRKLVEEERWIPLDKFLQLGTEGAWSSTDPSVQRIFYSQSYCITRFLAYDPKLGKPFAELVRFASSMFDFAVPQRLRGKFVSSIGDPHVVDQRITDWLKHAPLVPWTTRGSGEFRPRPDGSYVFDTGTRRGNLVHTQSIANEKRIRIDYETGKADLSAIFFALAGKRSYRLHLDNEIDLLSCENANNCQSVARAPADAAKLASPRHQVVIDLKDSGPVVEVDGTVRLTAEWPRVRVGEFGLVVKNGYAIVHSVEVSPLP
jgi:hypothetical protein